MQSVHFDPKSTSKMSSGRGIHTPFPAFVGSYFSSSLASTDQSSASVVMTTRLLLRLSSVNIRVYDKEVKLKDVDTFIAAKPLLVIS